MRKALILMFIFCFGWYSCKKETTTYPNQPQIYYLNTNPNAIQVSNPNAMVTVTFKFTDGDQNIGTDATEQDSTIFLKDSRDHDTTKDYTYVYPMPYIPDNYREDGGIEGKVTLKLNNAYFSPRDSFHLLAGKDTMYWSIYIKDNDGHRSNTIKTDTIYLTY